MFTATVALLVASYVGPTASPNTGYTAPQTRYRRIRNERNQNNAYSNPQNQAYHSQGFLREDGWTTRERAAQGRLVVPELFR